MDYLLASEYEAHGLEATTPAAWVTAASSLIDAHCRRATVGVARYVERLRLAGGRNTVRLSYLPLASVAPAITPIISARGRYGLPRRGEGVNSDFAADVAQAFALPGTWSDITVQAIDWCAETGELSFPVNALGLGFNEAEITYNAGFAAIPEPVKFACAQMVRNALATPALNVRASNLDRMHLEYFAGTLLDADVRTMLAPYVVQPVG
jgi:hypothetical protein